ncbi:ABC transporter ATP-binding protein [Ethanoligenens sp.]|uniref:ABC transporter ATP-binding protein n=1 Tax=Ethanoligenens sp. TaxID=2099655 RepID=UPI0039EA30F3
MEQPDRLVVSGITKTFRRDGKEIIALQKVNFSVKEGRFVSIIGPSGCGKSTLFHIIAGLLRPTAGQVLANGQDIVGRAGTVGYMLQKDMLLPWRSILDNIILGLEIRGVPRMESVKRALPLMAQYGLNGFEKSYPYELSGGMRQRAALLRTLLYDRHIMLLDEPFGALDAQTRLHMQNWLLEIWQDFKKTILFVTHDIDEAVYLSDDIYVFSPRPGRIQAKLEVPIPRPRSPEDMTSPQFAVLKHQLLELLFSGAPSAADIG